MSEKYITLEREAWEKLCGAVKNLSSVSEALDDENLSTESTFSSVKIKEMIDAIPTFDGNPDDFILKENIKTVITGGCTDEQVPSAKALYDVMVAKVDGMDGVLSLTYYEDENAVKVEIEDHDEQTLITDENIGDYALSLDCSRKYYDLGAWIAKEGIGGCDFDTLLYSVYNKTYSGNNPLVISGFVDEGMDSLYSSIRTAIFGSEIGSGYGVLTFTVDDIGMMEITYNLTHQNGTYINMYQNGQLRGWRSLDVKDDVLSLDGGTMNQNAEINLPSTGLGSKVEIKDEYLTTSLYADGLYIEDSDASESTHVGAGGITTPSLTVGGKDVMTTDDVSFTQTVTSGTKIGAITVNGSSKNIYAPTSALDCSNSYNLQFKNSVINSSASSYYGIAMGASSIMGGQYNVVIGSYLNYGLSGESNNQFIIGQLNTPIASGSNAKDLTALTDQLGEATAFVIGNGYYSAMEGMQQSNAFRIDYTGKTYGKEFLSSGADYSELLEWKDQNTDNEDRVGYFVTLDENYIKLANAGEYIVGAVSGIPSVVGNEADQWQGRYVKDDFGRVMYTEWEETNEETGETVTKSAPIINASYDPTLEYVNRGKRQEWDNVGMLGIIRVYDDGTCEANSYCKVADGGIATSATVEEHGYLTPVFRVMRRISDNVIEIFFR